MVPSAMKSLKRARHVTSEFHRIQRELDVVAGDSRDGTPSARARADRQRLERQLDSLGGRQAYQEASVLTTARHRTCKWVFAVLTKLGRFEEAVAAADHAIFLNPEWAKGYFRKGAALFALEKSHEAVVAYDAGLKVEPDNKDLKQGRELAAKNAANDEAKAKEASKDSKPERETKDTVAGEHSESEKYANELEDFLDGVAPSLARLHAKRKREEEEAIEQIFTDAKELSKTMSGGNKNPKGDRWEDFFCEQRVR